MCPHPACTPLSPHAKQPGHSPPLPAHHPVPEHSDISPAGNAEHPAVGRKHGFIITATCGRTFLPSDTRFYGFPDTIFQPELTDTTRAFNSLFASPQPRQRLARSPTCPPLPHPSSWNRNLSARLSILQPAVDVLQREGPGCRAVLNAPLAPGLGRGDAGGAYLVKGRKAPAAVLLQHPEAEHSIAEGFHLGSAL